MKKTLFLSAAALLALCSCDDDDIIWDVAPISITVSVADADGNDLLNPELNAPIAQGATVSWRGATYEADTITWGFHDTYATYPTRAIMPHFVGAKIVPAKLLGQYDSNQWLLFLGEFDGAATVSNETIAITWGDGGRDEIRFSNKCEEGKKLKIQRSVFFNNQQVDGITSFHITKIL